MTFAHRSERTKFHAWHSKIVCPAMMLSSFLDVSFVHLYLPQCFLRFVSGALQRFRSAPTESWGGAPVPCVAKGCRYGNDKVKQYFACFTFVMI